MTQPNKMRILSLPHVLRERLHYSSNKYVRMGFVAILGIVSLTGCNALDVNDPTAFRVGYVANEFGASAAVNGARRELMLALQSAVLQTGLLSDEFIGPGSNNDRITQPTAGHDVYSAWQHAYSQMTTGLPLVQKYSPSSQHGAQVGEMFALRGYVLLNLAEQMCPGFPIIRLEVDGEIITPHHDSDPQTADSAFTRALANFDSALATATDSTRVRTLAQIGRGRALLGLGRLAEAQAAVATVSTDYAWTLASQYALYAPFIWDFDKSVANTEGVNGLDYITARDPRVVVGFQVRWDGDTLWSPSKYTNTLFDPIVVASGIEARLIEAESQLATAPSGPEWLATLNGLRATVGLADTTDPGTTTGRLNLLFRERAFWLFATAHRLGDMRRLIAFYGRDPETVFPTGQITADWAYGTWTSLQFDGASEHAFYPKITGCTGQ